MRPLESARFTLLAGDREGNILLNLILSTIALPLVECYPSEFPVNAKTPPFSRLLVSHFLAWHANAGLPGSGFAKLATL